MAQGKKPNYAVILFSVVLFISFLFFVFKFFYYIEGQRGQIRSAVVFFMSAIFALSSFFPKKKLAILAAFSVIFISSIGVMDLVCHGPGAGVFGLTPKYPKDFNVNFYAAKELYVNGGSPYGIREKYQLPDYSISFPFPTYAIYWACSGFGYWGKDITGLSITFVNLFLAFLIIWVSLRLANIRVFISLLKADNTWSSLTILFLILNSLLWGVVMMGQTPIIMACFLIIGLWYSRKRSVLFAALSVLFLSLGMLIKPNFALFLFYFPGVWLKDFFDSPLRDKRHHYLLIFMFSILFAIFFFLITIVTPHGVNWSIYKEFIYQILPLLGETQVTAPFNISLIGVIYGLFAKAVSFKFASVVLAGIAITLGIYKRLPWPVWLVLPLLVSPFTWITYTILLLPAQFFIARECIKKATGSFESAILVLSVGMIYIGRTYISAVGLILIFFLTVQATKTRRHEKREFD